MVCDKTRINLKVQHSEVFLKCIIAFWFVFPCKPLGVLWKHFKNVKISFTRRKTSLFSLYKEVIFLAKNIFIEKEELPKQLSSHEMINLVNDLYFLGAYF